MKRRNPVKILYQILKSAHIEKIILGYLLVFFIVAGLVLFAEPEIDKYGDALWYCFVATTTIGFGDFAATSILARILTVILYIYTLIILALFTAVTTQYIFDMVKLRYNEARTVFLDDLEHLEELPKERLAEISAKIRERKGH